MATDSSDSGSWLSSAKDGITLARESVLLLCIVVLIALLAFSPETIGSVLVRARVQSVELPGFAIKVLEESRQQVEQATASVAAAREQVNVSNSQLQAAESRIQQALSVTPASSPARPILVDAKANVVASRMQLVTGSRVKLDEATTKLETTSAAQRALFTRIKSGAP